LPFNIEEFIDICVNYAGDSWVIRFEHILKEAATVTILTDEFWLNDDTLFEQTNTFMQGTTILRARQLENTPLLLALLDSETIAKIGGTQSCIDQWKLLKHPFEIINLGDIRSTTPSKMSSANKINNEKLIGTTSRFKKHNTIQADLNYTRTMKTQIFIGLVGAERSLQKRNPDILFHFLTMLMQFIADEKYQPVHKDSLGNGLNIIFNDANEAANFALNIRNKYYKYNWAEYGIQDTMEIKIAIHSCPVLVRTDPLSNMKNFYGSQVLFASHMEKSTAPGSICISEQTAVLLVQYTQFYCDFIGESSLHQINQKIRLYRLHKIENT